jgi:hypothetical protein
VNHLAPQDHIPLGITRGTSWFLTIVAARNNLVPLYIIVVP